MPAHAGESGTGQPAYSAQSTELPLERPPTIAEASAASVGRHRPEPATVARWAGECERATEEVREPPPADDRGVPRVRQGGLGAAVDDLTGAVPRRDVCRAAPGPSLRGIRGSAAGHPRRRPEGPQQ